ncbi:RNA polymerase sigma24 factor [Microlunatus endophyticus]|uniref:RNA polymerase sigma24 factor n=1 Tax=Microlunatus endophyticus TaxID=1716077 RepID=A0A917SHA5_9ACTN|nr:SigE family RNA polymerase sigma factor [Microlunatus endophyticus]GGL78958.1 RNA polymerase sigma24 factor [Microlunatus endophyticus]
MGDVRDVEFTAFVASQRPRLFRLAYLLAGNEHLAEDIVQRALVKLYGSWKRVRRANSVEAYVRRAVVNSHLDEGSRPWRRERPGIELIDVAEEPVGLSVEDSDALWAALRALPVRQRRVVVLRHYWGLSVEETAADLGVRPGTVKSQTSAALQTLRARLLVTIREGDQ